MEALTAYLDEDRGRRTKLAQDLGITPGAISQWARVPAERLIEIERCTGIRRELLRPDLFSEAQGTAA